MTDDQIPSNDDATIGPRWLPATLVVVATILAVVTTMTTWARTQALDTDQWVEVSGELINEPDVQQALSAYLADELFSSVDVAAALESRLPENLTGLAGPLAGALRGPTTDAIEKIVASSRFQSLWLEANRVAHEAAVKILRDDTRDSVSTADGTIVLDLGTAVRNLGEQIGIPQSALDRLPDNVGQITVLQSDELATAQNAVKVLDFASWFLYIVIVALYAGAVYLAVGRRRQMLRSVGISLIIAGLSVLLIRAVGIRTTVETFVEDSTNKPLAELVTSVVTVLLRQMAWTGVVYGLLIIAVATLLGPHRWAVAVRTRIAGVTDSTAAVVGVCFGTVLLLLWWSPGGAFDRWITALVLVALVVGAVVAVILSGRQELATAGSPAPGDSTPSDADTASTTESVS